TEHMVCRWLDTDCVLAFLKILPLKLAGKLPLVDLDHKSDPAPAIEGFVYHRHRDLPIGVSSERVFPDLLVKTGTWSGQCSIADLLAFVLRFMGCPDNMVDGGQISAAFGQHRVPDVDVIAIHMRSAVKSVIDHAIEQTDIV